MRSSRTEGQTHVPCICSQVLNHGTIRAVLETFTFKYEVSFGLCRHSLSTLRKFPFILGLLCVFIMKGCEILLNTSFATIEMVMWGFPTLLQLRYNLHSIKFTFKVAFSVLTKLGNHHYLIPKPLHHPPPKISYFPLSLFLWQPLSTSCLYGCSIYQYFISFYC